MTTTTYTDEARQVVGNFVIRAGKTFLVVRCNDVLGEERKVRITPRDVAVFYRYQAGSFSGCRTLAGLTGDWRPVSDLARACLSYFRTMCIVQLRRAARRVGLVPRF